MWGSDSYFLIIYGGSRVLVGNFLRSILGNYFNVFEYLNIRRSYIWLG